VYVDCDVTDRTDLEAAAEAATEFGGLDIWVNNAGIHNVIDFLEVTEEDYDRLMDVNLKGTFFGAQVAGQHFVETGDDGTIINMASAAAVRTGADMPRYGPSKGGVQQLTYSLADRFGDDGIRVNCINPSWIETEMVADSPLSHGEQAEQLRKSPTSRCFWPVTSPPTSTGNGSSSTVDSRTRRGWTHPSVVSLGTGCDKMVGATLTAESNQNCELSSGFRSDKSVP